MKWVAAAVALLLVAGGTAVWTDLDQQRSKVEFARERRLAAEKLLAEGARRRRKPNDWRRKRPENRRIESGSRPRKKCVGSPRRSERKQQPPPCHRPSLS